MDKPDQTFLRAYISCVMYCCLACLSQVMRTWWMLTIFLFASAQHWCRCRQIMTKSATRTMSTNSSAYLSSITRKYSRPTAASCMRSSWWKKRSKCYVWFFLAVVTLQNVITTLSAKFFFTLVPYFITGRCREAATCWYCFYSVAKNQYFAL